MAVCKPYSELGTSAQSPHFPRQAVCLLLCLIRPRAFTSLFYWPIRSFFALWAAASPTPVPSFLLFSSSSENLFFLTSDSCRQNQIKHQKNYTNIKNHAKKGIYLCHGLSNILCLLLKNPCGWIWLLRANYEQRIQFIPYFGYWRGYLYPVRVYLFKIHEIDWSYYGLHSPGFNELQHQPGLRCPGGMSYPSVSYCDIC